MDKFVWELTRAKREGRSPCYMDFAIVAAVNVSPRTVDLTIAGGTVEGVVYNRDITLAEGDLVKVTIQGTDIFVDCAVG